MGPMLKSLDRGTRGGGSRPLDPPPWIRHWGGGGGGCKGNHINTDESMDRTCRLPPEYWQYFQYNIQRLYKGDEMGLYLQQWFLTYRNGHQVTANVFTHSNDTRLTISITIYTHNIDPTPQQRHFASTAMTVTNSKCMLPIYASQ